MYRYILGLDAEQQQYCLFIHFLFSQGEGGAPGLPGIAGPRGGPVSIKDIFRVFVTTQAKVSCVSLSNPTPGILIATFSVLSLRRNEIQEDVKFAESEIYEMIFKV